MSLKDESNFVFICLLRNAFHYYMHMFWLHPTTHNLIHPYLVPSVGWAGCQLNPELEGTERNYTRITKH